MRPCLLIFIAFAFSSCDSARISTLEKENKELRAAVAAKTKIIGLDTQAKCAAGAKTFWEENWPPDDTTILRTYSNHYNSKLGRSPEALETARLRSLQRPSLTAIGPATVAL